MKLTGLIKGYGSHGIVFVIFIFAELERCT